MEPGPVLAVETRMDRIQAVHTGHAVLLGPDGAILQSWGDLDSATYWRSAAKPFQALPFAGVARSLGLGDAEMAVACGSHAAEPFHVAAVQRILDSCGLSVRDLQCGVHDPGPLAGPVPSGGWTALYNNCSGKHAAMLAFCKTRGLPLDSYREPSHPLQAEIQEIVAVAAGVAAADVPSGLDGCGLPTYFLPVSRLARSFQWLHTGGDPRAGWLLDAVARHPAMVGGTGNADTDLPTVTQGRIISKYGALGVVAAVNRASGQSLAVKIAAGNAQPARAVALAIMHHSGWFRDGEAQRLGDHLRPPLRNHAGALVGHLQTRIA